MKKGKNRGLLYGSSGAQRRHEVHNIYVSCNCTNTIRRANKQCFKFHYQLHCEIFDGWNKNVDTFEIDIHILFDVIGSVMDSLALYTVVDVKFQFENTPCPLYNCTKETFLGMSLWIYHYDILITNIQCPVCPQTRGSSTFLLCG